jgi:hypothetical protein
MTTSVRDVREQGLGATLRRDAWWIQPVLTALVLGSFGIYATWAAWVNRYYEWGPYLSPFYSPLIKTSWWPLSPAFLILIFPGGFRATCYYYRKAYYRAFFLDPVACAVGEPRHGYKETVSLHSPERTAGSCTRRWFHLHSLLRRPPATLAGRQIRAPVRSSRCRDARDGAQCQPPVSYARLPLAAASHRRQCGLFLLRARRASRRGAA